MDAIQLLGHVRQNPGDKKARIALAVYNTELFLQLGRIGTGTSALDPRVLEYIYQSMQLIPREFNFDSLRALCVNGYGCKFQYTNRSRDSWSHFEKAPAGSIQDGYINLLGGLASDKVGYVSEVASCLGVALENPVLPKDKKEKAKEIISSYIAKAEELVTTRKNQALLSQIGEGLHKGFSDGTHENALGGFFEGIANTRREAFGTGDGSYHFGFALKNDKVRERLIKLAEKLTTKCSEPKILNAIGSSLLEEVKFEKETPAVLKQGAQGEWYCGVACQAVKRFDNAAFHYKMAATHPEFTERATPKAEECSKYPQKLPKGTMTTETIEAEKRQLAEALGHVGMYEDFIKRKALDGLVAELDTKGAGFKI